MVTIEGYLPCAQCTEADRCNIFETKIEHRATIISFNK
ncbi:hypothetical protein Leryth_000631 [Lithospermum erythrorhizon]|nr:hypothetical protein Leryth_000631 [Lithospermum erythrorhizon]